MDVQKSPKRRKSVKTSMGISFSADYNVKADVDYERGRNKYLIKAEL